MLLAGALSLGACERNSKPDAVTRPPDSPTHTESAPAVDPKPEPAPEPDAPPPQLEVRAEAHDGVLSVSIENHDQRLVSLAHSAALRGDPMAGDVDVAGQCTAAEPTGGCQPLAPGAALFLSPLRARKPDGTCTNVAPGHYTLTLRDCATGAKVEARLDF